VAAGGTADGGSDTGAGRQPPVASRIDARAAGNIPERQARARTKFLCCIGLSIEKKIGGYAWKTGKKTGVR
jgi:hypothetical protein